MRSRRNTTDYMPVLLLDSNPARAAELAASLEIKGFPTCVVHSAAGAQAAIRDVRFATLIVVSDADVGAGLEEVDALRRKAARSWIIVVSPRCDAGTCKLIHRHGGDACLAAPASIDELSMRLAAFQLRARPTF
jgi:DNA-binding response OmpR family regulator